MAVNPHQSGHHPVIAEQVKDPPRPRADGRGGRQYQLRRVKSTDLAPGLRTVLNQFESATAHYIDQMNRVEDLTAMDTAENVPQHEKDMLEAAQLAQDRAKQALIRKLLRMQNGEELVDVEQLKRRLRKMARFIHNLSMILKDNRDQRATDAAQALFASSPEVLEDVEKLIASRRKF